MADQLDIRQLLAEILESGRTPEEVCEECPELLPELREEWRRLRGVERQIDALFALPDSRPGSDGPSLTEARAAIPAIPGYDMEELIGHGGMGVVYKARHRKLNRPIAIKMMLAGLYAGPGERQRFLREAEAMASFRHPHIVPIHDVGDFEGLPYFTMELVDGGNLAQKLAGMPQPGRQAAMLVATLARAVAAAHENGIIHRDLKPANILLTADGTPKITDFGLARRVDGEAGLTYSGARVGTPSYMAPEQAAGESGSTGPAVDIYALGAILYETLTGRPPFRAETAAETERQVITQEPAPPSRLNARVPRDLETICLKCLEKSAQRRYGRASALADDLERFLRDEPIEARPVGTFERSARWARRRPALATVIVGGLVLASILLGGGLWLISERAAMLQAVEQDVVEVVRFQRQSSWVKSSDALKRARVRLGDRGPAKLRSRLDQAGRDQALVSLLDSIRLKRAGRVSATVGYGEQDYEQAFQVAGLFQLDDKPEAVATRVRASNIHAALVAAVDDWALCVGRGFDLSRLSWLLEVAKKADPDPTGWRDRFRDPAARGNRDELIRLAASANMAETPVNLLMALGELLQKHGGDAIPFFRAVQKQHPTDFWANHQLGFALNDTEPAEAVRFYQAALAIRPDTPGLYNNLAAALARIGRTEEPDFYFRQAIRLDPNNAMYRASLGFSLMNAGRDLEAIDQFQHGLTLKPDPRSLYRLHGGLRQTFFRQGRLNDARLAWRRVLDAGPSDHQFWDGYAEFCLFLGQEGEYRWARRALLDRFSAVEDPNVAEKTGRACLLLAASDGELPRAIALVDRALAKDREQPLGFHAFFLFAKGLAEYRLGRLDRSIAIMEGAARPVLGPAPGLVRAMCRHHLGHEEEALKELASAIARHDWSPARAESADDWIDHVLRREAEAMIVPHLDALLLANNLPRSHEERLALLGICQFRGLYHRVATLYSEAFAVDPKLPEDLHSQVRYTAARYASLTGCPRSETEANLDEPARARWRKQARDWLRADLAALAKYLNHSDVRFRNFLATTLAKWAADPDLAGLRDPAALKKLSAPERLECENLWSGHAALVKQSRDSR